MCCRAILAGSVILSIWCLATFAQSTGEQTASPPIDEITRVLNALSAYRSIDLQATSRIKVKNLGGDEKSGPLVALDEIEVKRSGSRSMVSQKEVVERPGAPIWRAQHDFIVDKTGGFYDWQAKLDNSLHQIEETDGLALSLTSERISGQKPVNRDHLGLNDSGVALWIIGYLPLAGYLAQPSNALIRSDQESTRIVTHTEYGDLTLVTSKSSGWLPESFELVKLPTHQTVGGLVRTVYHGKVKAVTWSGKATGFSSDSSGRWAPSNIAITRRTEWIGKAVEIGTTNISIKRLVFDPPLSDSDFKSTIVLPSGWPVNIRGAKHLPYHWDGTKVVPTILEDASPAPMELPKRQRSHNRMFLLVANLVLALIVALCVWIKVRRRHVRP